MVYLLNPRKLMLFSQIICGVGSIPGGANYFSPVFGAIAFYFMLGGQALGLTIRVRDVFVLVG
jgi:hypothetical protein